MSGKKSLWEKYYSYASHTIQKNEGVQNGYTYARKITQVIWDTPFVKRIRIVFSNEQVDIRISLAVIIGGTASLTAFIAILFQILGPFSNVEILYLPFIAMLGYHWNWRHGSGAAFCSILFVYIFLMPPDGILKPLTHIETAQIIVSIFAMIFILSLAQLARMGRIVTEKEAGRVKALNAVGVALAQTFDEEHLLNMIASVSIELTGATFAAFTLRPVDSSGTPLVESRGNLFQLAAVVGVTPEEAEALRRVALGGRGELEPIFHQGISVRVDDMFDVYAKRAESAHVLYINIKHTAPEMVGMPRNHPMFRSFLGSPLIDRKNRVRGGLLLGHPDPHKFTQDDEALLNGLAAQAMVALENARMFRTEIAQAKELDTIFENISDGVLLVNERGEALRENNAAKLLRSTILNDAGEDIHAKFEIIPAKKTIKDGSYQSEPIVFEDASGVLREFSVSATRFELEDTESLLARRAHKLNGAQIQTLGVVIMWHDVTEIRRLLEEQKARASAEARKELLQTIIDEQPSGVYLVRGKNAELMLANRAAMEIWGAEWKMNQPLQDFMSENSIAVYKSHGRALQFEELGTIRSLRSDNAANHFEEIIRRKDGTEKAVLFSAVPMDKQILHWTMIGALNESDIQLEPVSLVVLQDISAMKEAENTKDQFITMAAHELKTPMAAVKGYADMLVTHSGDTANSAPLSEWQQEAISTIQLSISRLVELTEDLLDVTRLQADRLELTIEPHDIIALMKRVVKRFRAMTQKHTIQTKFPDGYLVVMIDPARTEQVMGNIISNAIKYSPDGGEICITIKRSSDANMAEVSVIDHGIGIPQSQHSRIFSRFERADNARSLSISGTGLGLFISKEIIERQGGHIWFVSDLGKGSTFFIALPLALPIDEE